LTWSYRQINNSALHHIVSNVTTVQYSMLEMDAELQRHARMPIPWIKKRSSK